jgi:hypothetical protein
MINYRNAKFTSLPGISQLEMRAAGMQQRVFPTIYSLTILLVMLAHSGMLIVLVMGTSINLFRDSIASLGGARNPQVLLVHSGFSLRPPRSQTAHDN